MKTEGDSFEEYDRYWHFLTILGRDDEALAVLQDLVIPGLPYRTASFMVYPHFDPRPFPEVMAALAREGITPPPPKAIPFRCKP